MPSKSVERQRVDPETPRRAARMQRLSATVHTNAALGFPFIRLLWCFQMMMMMMELEGVQRSRCLHTIYTIPLLHAPLQRRFEEHVCAVWTPASAPGSSSETDGVWRGPSALAERALGAWSRSWKRTGGVGDCYSLVWTGGTSSVPSQLS